MKFYYTPRRRTRYLAAIWKSCLLKKDNFSRDYFRDESWEEFLVILIIIRHLLLPYRLYNVIYRNFHIRKDKDRNSRNMAIERNKSFTISLVAHVPPIYVSWI